MIISTYAALLAFYYIYLSFNVIKVRKKEQISLGDNGNVKLQRAVRAHANFMEYVPFTIILLFLAEYQGLASHYCNILGAALLIGRVFHNLGIVEAKLKYRQIGAVATFLVMVISAFILLVTRNS
ncbi:MULTISPECIES: MAPEG family protein [unclassified Pseudoalteromonas]|uniref:MAPEG family protein n=1 Tax=unclassified Pseudoalteromonas TaxID=194690 RepID=UPI0007322B6A|nr:MULTISPECIES: MAPEG family protein [unclassified Pseudoalteromonas]MBW4965716.1 MAPEG family protein [Pseudoalteromonas sp. CR1]KTF14515.1 glutathione metabolism protein [Pseudoalteromonas sp. 10-33]TMN82892.1 glutathione metabolism protein [Pseudoalteromonas sp. S410]TMN90293.1 glutathione metabolism protein [Pseudoalteromonas sp. S408]TMO00856.1 glutathione metabolism protein [Pseudoalteromonas sp. S407]